MEKIIYLIELGQDSDIEVLKAATAGPVADAAGSAGGRVTTLHLADLNDWIASECPTRQIGDASRVSALLSAWLPSAHLAAPITEALQSCSQQLHAYVVAEAVWQAEEQAYGGGQLRPGVSFVTCLNRNPALDDAAFYRHWDEHAVDSSSLHPLRQSYIRHAVVRPLTDNAPHFDGIVFEQFPSRAVFADDQQFYDAEFAQQIAEHMMAMIDLQSLCSNGFSEYRFQSDPLA